MIEIEGTSHVAVPCSGHDHVVLRTHLTISEGAMDNLRWILNAAARGQDFAANGDMRDCAGSLFNDLGFGDDPSLWPEGPPQ